MADRRVASDPRSGPPVPPVEPGPDRSEETAARGDQGEQPFLDRQPADVGEHHR